MAPKTTPSLVAHRGYPLHYPENTLLGIQAAVEAGARSFEFDVQLSKDQVPFLCHDASLKRTAGLERDIMALTSDELAGVDVGEPARFGARYTGTRPTPLAELVAWLKHQAGVTAFVEIKRQSLVHFGAGLVVERVMQALAPALARCVVISFDAPCLALARAQDAPAIGWALRDAGSATAKTLQQLKPDYLFAGDKLFPEAYTALRGRWLWAVYEVQDPAYARRLTAQGADLVETDAIGEMLTALAQPA